MTNGIKEITARINKMTETAKEVSTDLGAVKSVQKEQEAKKVEAKKQTLIPEEWKGSKAVRIRKNAVKKIRMIADSTKTCTSYTLWNHFSGARFEQTPDQIFENIYSNLNNSNASLRIYNGVARLHHHSNYWVEFNMNTK